jgi:hypothetical protein
MALKFNFGIKSGVVEGKNSNKVGPTKATRTVKQKKKKKTGGKKSTLTKNNQALLRSLKLLR